MIIDKNKKEKTPCAAQTASLFLRGSVHKRIGGKVSCGHIHRVKLFVTLFLSLENKVEKIPWEFNKKNISDCL